MVDLFSAPGLREYDEITPDSERRLRRVLDAQRVWIEACRGPDRRATVAALAERRNAIFALVDAIALLEDYAADA